jgi:hypothetical protein
VLHPVSDLTTATAVDVAVLGVAPHTDGASYVGSRPPVSMSASPTSSTG